MLTAEEIKKMYDLLPPGRHKVTISEIKRNPAKNKSGINYIMVVKDDQDRTAVARFHESDSTRSGRLGHLYAATAVDPDMPIAEAVDLFLGQELMVQVKKNKWGWVNVHKILLD